VTGIGLAGLVADGGEDGVGGVTELVSGGGWDILRADGLVQTRLS
jgi:hypothetical protein